MLFAERSWLYEIYEDLFVSRSGEDSWSGPLIEILVTKIHTPDDCYLQVISPAKGSSPALLTDAVR